MPRVWVQSLVRKLRSHKVRGMEKFKKEIRKTTPPPQENPGRFTTNRDKPEVK